MDDPKLGRQWVWLALAIYAIIMIMAVAPGHERGEVNLVPFAVHLAGLRLWLRGLDSPWAILDLAGNIAVFLPLGYALAAGLRHLGWRFPGRVTLLAVFLGSALIEAVQYKFIPTRNADTTDIILDCIGAAIGVWLATRGMRQPARQGAPSWNGDD